MDLFNTFIIAFGTVYLSYISACVGLSLRMKNEENGSGHGMVLMGLEMFVVRGSKFFLMSVPPTILLFQVISPIFMIFMAFLIGFIFPKIVINGVFSLLDYQ